MSPPGNYNSELYLPELILYLIRIESFLIVDPSEAGVIGLDEASDFLLGVVVEFSPARFLVES